MSESNPAGSDRESVVRQILDRVAAGELSSADAAVLIAAATNQSGSAEAGRPAESAGPAGAADAAGGGGAARGRAGSDVWAEATDDPRAPIANQAAGDAAPAGQAAGSAAQADAASAGQADADAESGRPQDRVQDQPQDAPQDQLRDAGVEDSGALDQERDEHADVPIPAGVQKVMIKAIGRRVRLIGEPAVSGVAVDGPHLIKRDGETLIVSSDGDMGVSIDGLSMLRTRSVGDLRSHLGGFAKELQVRVNPRLKVEVEVTGGSVTAERVPSLNRVRVTAGTAKVSDVDGPLDLLVQAGSATLDAQITKGRSRVRVESGSANVQLRRGSDVRVHSDAQLGRVTWVGAVNGPSTDVEIGQGRAALDVEVLMGAAQITAD
jgi:hypothetical protein